MALYPSLVLVGLGAATAPEPTSSVGTLAYLLAAALVGGLGTAGVNLYKAKRLGKSQADALVGETMANVSKAATEMLRAARLELDRATAAKDELTTLLLTRNSRIADLEEQVREHVRKYHELNGERDRLQRQLTQAVEQKANVDVDLRACREHVDELQLEVTALETLKGADGE